MECPVEGDKGVLGVLIKSICNPHTHRHTTGEELGMASLHSGGQLVSQAPGYLLPILQDEGSGGDGHVQFKVHCQDLWGEKKGGAELVTWFSINKTSSNLCFVYHDCLNGPIRLIYSIRLFTISEAISYPPTSIIHLSLGLLFTDFFIASIQIGVIVE